MFTSFFYLLRARGLKVSLNEWMSLIEALDKGLHNSSFTGFYYLCRAILVKSEADFDKFDGAFLEYFKDMERATDELPKELLDWLNKPREELDGSFSEADMLRNMGLSEDMIQQMFLERLKEQHEQHNGGAKWIGTRGASPFGNNGQINKGIREALATLSDTAGALVRVTLICFSQKAYTSMEGEKAVDALNKYRDLLPESTTEVSAAFAELDKQLQSVCEQYPSRYKPVIIVISDGFNTDNEATFINALKKLETNGHFRSAVKSAIALGSNSSDVALAAFPGHIENVFKKDVSSGSVAGLIELVKIVTLTSVDTIKHDRGDVLNLTAEDLIVAPEGEGNEPVDLNSDVN